MGPRKCEVCEEAQSKYKCPSCLIPYCSLACFKKHKETPCSKPEPINEEKVYPSAATNDDKPCYVDEQNEVLQESQLQSLAASNEIRDLIKNEKLQKVIYKIDCSADPENELDKSMEEESFRLFAEKISSIIGS
ncbi:zinc finger HIT domain-containing protein 3 [Sesamum indicum]|uniref:Zinc finger HIT domain-containing protein 3 n=1 Tax=Sesamum indicum TaxID=4182 RepID=A0A6I9TC75_SESIN|nr:zinc finger HIT domain-containing protein 3 [Sesamum indicum]